MDIKELVDTTLGPLGSFVPLVVPNRQQSMQSTNNIMQDVRGQSLPTFNMPENYMSSNVYLSSNTWEDAYNRRNDRPMMAPPPTYMSNLTSYPPTMPDPYLRYQPKHEFQPMYENPGPMYMPLQKRELPLSENPQWDNNYERLRDFYLVHGHCLVSVEKDPALFHWCRNQRHFNSLSEARVARLDSIDFNWEELPPSPQINTTPKRKARVVKKEEPEYDSEPEDDEDDDFELSDDHAIHAITKMANSANGEGKRSFSPFKSGSSSSPSAVKATDPKQTWESYYGRLLYFYQQNNHCRIPYGQDRPLSTWISNQRAARNNNALTPEQITKLDQIGFIWNPKKGSGGNTAAKKAKNDEEWDKHFAKLKEFKDKQGHCCIPNSTDAWMNQWVRLQRSNEKRGLLSLERKKKLDHIGFPWVVPPAGARYAVYNGSSPTKDEPNSPNSDSNSPPSSSRNVSPIPVENGNNYTDDNNDD